MGLVAEKMAASRFSCRKYIDKPIEEGHLERILGYTQPYRVVVTREKSMKDKVRECLYGSNQSSTKNASAFVTFLCDINPCQNIDMYVNMMKRSNTPQQSIDEHVGFFKDVFPQSICLQCLPNNVNPPSVALAEQNTGMVVGSFLNLCTAYGLATLAMGGVMKEKLLKLLKVPEGYTVSMVCAVGYAAASAHAFETARYLPSEVIFENEFGKPMPNVLDTNPKNNVKK